MRKKIHVSNIFYHFLLAVSLGNWASKMSEKFKLDRKIGFQNTFYTKCINVIIDSIGPLIILRSICSDLGSIECVYIPVRVCWAEIGLRAPTCTCHGFETHFKNCKFTQKGEG